MSEVKVVIYSPQGQPVGYFLNPSIAKYPEGEYELEGRFYDSANQLAMKIDLNPQAIPYSADLSTVKDVPFTHLKNVYVQRGRQPVKMTGIGSN